MASLLYHTEYRKEYLINTNYSNNYHQSFGSFKFSKEAKEVIKCSITSKSKIETFEKIINMENSGKRAARKIDIDVISDLTGGPELVAGYNDGNCFQGMWCSPLSFLKRVVREADECANSDIAKAIDKLI